MSSRLVRVASPGPRVSEGPALSLSTIQTTPTKITQVLFQEMQKNYDIKRVREKHFFYKQIITI